jgi:competence protein ComEC
MVDGFFGYFIGLLISQSPWIAIACFLLYGSWLLYKKSIKTLIIVSCFLVMGAGWSSLKSHPKAFQQSWMVVTSKNADSLITWQLGEFYYLSVENHAYQLGDVLAISGHVVPLKMNHYESRFDYGNYLLTQGVKHRIQNPTIRRIFHYPFSSILLLSQWHDSIPEKSQQIMSLFLWDEPLEGNTLFEYANIMGLTIYFSQSGLLLLFLENMLQSFMKTLTKKNHHHRVGLLFYLILMVMNPFSVIILRRFLVNLFEQMHPKGVQSKFNKNVYIFVLMTIFSRYIVFNWSFLMFFVLRIIRWLNEAVRPTIHPIIHPILFPLILSLFFGVLNSFSTGYFSPFQSLVLLSIFPWIFGLILLAMLSMVFLTFLPLLLAYERWMFSWIRFVQLLDMKILIGVNPFFWLGMVVMVLIIIYALQQQLRSVFKSAFALAIFAFIVQSMPYEQFYFTQLSFINVGQGDAMLLQHHRQAWLIDTGGQLHFDLAKESLMPYLRKQKITHLNGVIITHQDFDHTGALFSLQQQMTIDEVITSPERFPLTIGGITLVNLNPIQNHADENTNSLVLYFDIQNVYFLLMGDAGVENEEAMMERQRPFPVEIIKIGHHGSNTSTSETFLDFVQPKTAIISAARINRYSHPHTEVINRLNDRMIRIRSTMDEGTITYKFYGSV